MMFILFWINIKHIIIKFFPQLTILFILRIVYIIIIIIFKWIKWHKIFIPRWSFWCSGLIIISEWVERHTISFRVSIFSLGSIKIDSCINWIWRCWINIVNLMRFICNISLLMLYSLMHLWHLWKNRRLSLAPLFLTNPLKWPPDGQPLLKLLIKNSQWIINIQIIYYLYVIFRIFRIFSVLLFNLSFL